MLFFIAIIAIALLLYFNNSVKNRRIDCSNKLAEKQEALIQMLREKRIQEENEKKNKSDL